MARAILIKLGKADSEKDISENLQSLGEVKSATRSSPWRQARTVNRVTRLA